MRFGVPFRVASLSLSAFALASCAISQRIDFSKPSSGSEPAVPSSSSLEEAEPAHKEVLFVGNSFTYFNDCDQVTQSIGMDLGLDIACSAVTEGGQHLIDTASSSDPVGKRLDEALKKKYTHIVLQEHSTTPVTSYGNFLSGVKQILAKIQATQDSPKVYLYATWSYPSFASSRGLSVPESESLLRKAYEDCAAATGTKVTNVGKAFSYVYENHPSINLYHTDSKHPCFAGTYLSACVHAATMFGLDVRKTAFLGSGAEKGNGTGTKQLIGEDDAKILRDVAYKTANALI